MRENLDPSWIGGEEAEIYRENILDHYKNPRNFGVLTKYTFKNRGINPLCGDNIELFVLLENNRVKDVKFHGGGCAISTASASMLTSKIKGMSLNELRKISQEDILEMIGINLGIVRMKCGLLCLKTLTNGIEKIKE